MRQEPEAAFNNVHFLWAQQHTRVKASQEMESDLDQCIAAHGDRGRGREWQEPRGRKNPAQDEPQAWLALGEKIEKERDPSFPLCMRDAREGWGYTLLNHLLWARLGPCRSSELPDVCKLQFSLSRLSQ